MRISAYYVTAFWISISIPGFALALPFTNHEVTEKPAVSASSPSSESSTSNVGASAQISYQAITDALSSAIPSTFDASGRQNVCADLNEVVSQTITKRIGGDVGRFLKRVVKFTTQVVTFNQVRHVCQDVDYKVDVARTSPVTVSQGINSVHVATTVAISGSAGFTGNVAKALALNKKNFRGSLGVAIDISLDVDEHWCPRLTANPSYRWVDRGELEIVHNVWLGIEGQVGDKINSQLKSAVSKLQEQITCTSITDAVKDIWHPYSFAFASPYDTSSKAYLTFSPSGAGFSGISYGAKDLSLALSMSGNLGITTVEQTPSAPLELPPLAHIATSTDDISIKLPAHIGYGDLANALQSYFKGRTFEEETPAGRVKMSVTEINLYPSNGQLALGITFSAETAHHLFNTKGSVYVLARPALDSDQQVIALRDISFTAALDNALWSSVSSIFNQQIKSALEKKISYDLKPAIASLQSKLQARASAEAAKQGILLTLQQNSAGLSDVRLGEQTLDVTAQFNGKADLTIREIKIPKLVH